jgi:hypothetical protein
MLLDVSNSGVLDQNDLAELNDGFPETSVMAREIELLQDLYVDRSMQKRKPGQIIDVTYRDYIELITRSCLTSELL